MLAHVFRPQGYLPSPVTSMCSNNSTVVVFRRSGTVELIDSRTLRRYLFLDICLEVSQSFFIDLNTVVALSTCGKVVVYEISTLQKKVLDLCASNISVTFHDAAFAERVFLYTNTRNELLQYKNGRSTLISSSTSRVSSILSSGQYILVGTFDGWVRILCGGKIVTEVEIKTRPTSIAAYGTMFVVTGENGCVCLINPISEIVMDRIQIREHSLNAVVVSGGRIHVSGVDSRLTCMDLSNSKLLKSYQGDPHITEVLCMTSDNGRIVSSGEDCVVVFSTAGSSQYTFKKVFDTSLCVGETRDYFFTAFDRSLDLYCFEGQHRDTVEHENPYNEFISFKISELVLEKINQRQAVFKHFLNIKALGKITAAAVSFDQRFVAFSTAKETVLYSLFRGTRLNIEKLRVFGPSKKVIFNSRKLIIQGLDKIITILDLENLETSEIGYEDYREVMEANEDVVVLAMMGKMYNIQEESFSQVSVRGTAVSSSRIVDGAVSTITIISEDESSTFQTVIEGCNVASTRTLTKKIHPGTEKAARAKEDCPVRDILYCSGQDILANTRVLFVCGPGLATYEIGTLIHGVAKHNGDALVVQSNYKSLSAGFKKSVFKEKYSNK